MKKLFVVLMMFSLMSVSFAQRDSVACLMTRYTGDNIVFVDSSKIFYADLKALEFRNHITKAMDNPDEPLSVGLEVCLVKIFLPFSELIRLEKEEIYFDSSTRYLSYSKRNEEQKQISRVLILLLISLFSMVSSNVLMHKAYYKKKPFLMALSFMAGMLSAGILFMLFLFYGIVYTLFIPAVVIVSFIWTYFPIFLPASFNEEWEKYFKWFYIIVYILFVATFIAIIFAY